MSNIRLRGSWARAIVFALASSIAVGGFACKKEEEKKAESKKEEKSDKDDKGKDKDKDKDKDKGADKGEKKKKGKKKELPKAEVKNPVPAEWETMVDEVRGYEFKVPKGTTGKNTTVEGANIWEGELPAPHKVELACIAFKDATLTKDDLVKKGSKIREAGDGVKDLKIGKPEDRGGDFSLATYTLTEKDGAKKKGLLLVVTDKTDNYLLFLESEEAKFKADEDTMNEIWQSFTMYSGGNDPGE